MDEAIVHPHRLREERETEVTAVGRQVCVIRGDQRFIQETCSYQSRRPEDDRVHQVDNIGSKLFETTYKKWAKEVKFEFWVKRSRFIP